MRPLAHSVRCVRRLGWFGTALGLAVFLAVLRSAAESPLPPRPPAPGTLQRARNPVQLTVLTDSTRAVGWISGVRDHAGESVTVRLGNKIHTIKIAPGNIFSWPFQVKEPTRALFAYGRLLRSVTLMPPSKQPPCVFFVIDRGAYRSRQTLRFAGFLRELDERGEFVPLAGRSVEVVLSSAQKKAAAARLKLTSDEQGRITGSYTFQENDPLDRYRLDIPGYRGSASVTLAEYRKSKTYLAIEGRTEGDHLRLRFRGRDYLDKPLRRASVQFIAQVVREPHRRSEGPLDGRQFAYADEEQPPALLLEDLSVEERALAEAEEAFQPMGGLSVAQKRQVMTEIKGRLELNPQGEGGYPLELRKSWLQPGHAVVVQGVLIDEHGREERCTRTLPLLRTNDALRLSLPRRAYQVNELISVTAETEDPAEWKGAASLVAFRLAVAPPAEAARPAPEVPPGLRAVPASNWESIRRVPVTAAAFRGDTATLRLAEPGAYVLVALLRRPDGSRWRQEIGCVVQPSSEPPALSLWLDRDTYQTGDTLKGTIHSKFADARVLLTLRDSTGLRLWRPLRLSEGTAELKIPLPADLRYGCAVEVRYADAPHAAEAVHVASRLIHVVPVEKLLTIRSTVKPEVEPGSKAALDLQVNRREPVDLIVSVYDRALLSIAAESPPEVRSFYLADDRIHQTHAREVIRQRLGGMSMAGLLERARGWFREHPEKAGTVEASIAQLVVASLGRQSLSTADVAQLLRMAGVPARALVDERTWTLPAGARLRQVSVAEWLETPQNGWRLHYSLIGDTLFLTSYHPAAKAKPWSASGAALVYYGTRPVANLGWQGGGNLGVGGGLGGLGGIGGIAGLGGQGFNQLGGNGMMGMGGFKVETVRQLSTAVAKSRTSLVQLGGDSDLPELRVRRDFSDSAYWNAQVRTDGEGRARVEVPLPDSLTRWRVVVTAITRDLHVGRHETSFRTARAFMVHPILPRFFVEGDRVRVAAEVQNRTPARQSVRVRLQLENGKIETPAEQETTLGPEGRGSVSWMIRAGAAGSAQLLLSASSAAGSDAALERLPVVRATVEQVLTRSGFCKDAADIDLPEGVDPRQVALELRFPPSLTADLIDTLDYLVDYPYGCVEQTMSRFLPAIKVAQLLQHHHIDHPGLKRKLPGCVAAGIRRLLELQHADGGWGWNGSGQTHEMMTPYALYGLLEAEKAGYKLGSETAIARGLIRLTKFIEQMGAAQSADRIFCMFVYGHRHELPAAWWQFIDVLRAAHQLSDYALALALDLAVQQKQSELAKRLAAELRGRAVAEGDRVHWRTAGFSHWGDDPSEITAVAIKALLAHDPKDPLIPGVLAYFAATKRGNHWNSTKDTALIVHALCDYLVRQDQNPRGRLRAAFRCNGGPVHEVLFDSSSESRTMTVPVAEVKAGRNRIAFPESSAGLMYRLTLRYPQPGRSTKPSSQGIHVTRRFWLLDSQGRRTRELKSGDSVPRGAYLESAVEAAPVNGDQMRFVLVENPRPACCEVVPESDRRFDQHGTPCVLREERERCLAYHHEQTSGPLVDRCVLHAELPGDYLAPAAHVEMMYRTEIRGHSGAFALRVRDK